ncbi:hypothetical protein IFT73_16675 [Aeromicrobium sp. CFBP 8757]|uniref:hypothetical protein n=1 Tax=Aeromicrobium sp. CFBP 8757 TaxID=2775288 RepID=UPI00177E6BA2|nr:hypothetical protein [Aeromicrobium sp. CFBP 8757]MBD8608493.1 hypothetical protein [Aeromicrobium sp. CFBP 8757]
MRTSILSRSLVAVASIAVGSVALAAVPATAATPSGITREQVLTAAAGVRANPDSTTGGIFGGGPGYGPAANRALRAMVNRVCITDPDGPELAVQSVAAATMTGQSADGVVVSAYILNTESDSSSVAGRVCSFGALATVADRSVLTGTATITGGATVALSGDAFVTPAVNLVFTSSGPTGELPTFSASGAAVQSNVVKIADKKTSKEKRAAKKKYTKRIASAKKSYAKALDKAGSSKSKKSAAKKAYKAKRASATAKYRTAVANFKLVTTKTPTPFSVSAQYDTSTL